MDEENIKYLNISALLQEWYRVNKRELPWRNTSDPYLIWISEIILQQTRVLQGMDYFLRFTERFPDIATLAAAGEDEVLKYWQGLGYYSRARNLHAAAKDVMDRFGGIFPSGYADVLSLKGIGEYTAAAIVSFAWNRPYPVVDGNVFRVLARLFALDTPIDTTQGKKTFTRLAEMLLDPLHAGLHNQAMMELGALCCVPQRPDCGNCPLQHHCQAFMQGNVLRFPVKQHKQKVRNRYFHYLYIRYKDTVWLSRRKEKDIWQGLYEFPLIETGTLLDFSGLQREEAFQALLREAEAMRVKVDSPVMKHVLSHQVLYAVFYRIDLDRPFETLKNYIPVRIDDLDNYALPRLIHIYVEKSDGNLPE